MRRVLAAVAIAAVSLAACGKKKEEAPAPKSLGEQTADISADTGTLREASAAVNEVIRNSTDCDLARPLIAPAKAKLDEAERRIRTTTGRATLEALRAQLKTVDQNCP